MPVHEVAADLLQQLSQDPHQCDSSDWHADPAHLGGIGFAPRFTNSLRRPATQGIHVSFNEVHRDVPKAAYTACSTSGLNFSNHELAVGLSQRHQSWHDFLSSSELDLHVKPRTSLQSFLATKNETLPASTVSTDHAVAEHNSVDTSDTHYNPRNGLYFLSALPFCAGAACAFELLKGRIAETDLQAPLPAIVQNAKQETSVLSGRSVWRVFEPYVRGSTGIKCAGYGLVHLVLLGAGIYVDLVLTQWNGVFWSSLQSKSAMKFYQLLWDFAFITGISIAIGIYSEYIDGMWHLHARDHLTRYFNQVWLKDGAMCKMQQSDEQVDNPDQRIEEDVDGFIASSRELLFGGLGSLAMLAVYGPMLLRMAPIQLVVFVLLWPVFGALMTHLLGRGLIPLSVAGQSATADFRSELVYVRDNADSLALTRAGPQLEQTLQGRFEVLKQVIYAQLNVTRILTFFKMLFGEYGGVIPLLLVAPSYFNGSIDLGTLMQLRIIVSRVSDSLAFPVGAYEQAIQWAAATNRLVFLQIQAEASKQDVRIPVAVGGDRILAADVSVMTPDGRCVVEGFELQVSAGDRVLVLGDAGQGKSLLVRTLAGLWSHMSGQVEIPEDCMFIQGFSFPPMSLRRLLLYPRDTIFDVEPVLRAVGAESVFKDLESVDIVRHWEEVLSREEQERLQLARLLLQKPRFAVLDDPLASLHREEANQLLKLVPDSTAVLMFSRRPLSTYRVVEMQHPGAQFFDPENTGPTAGVLSPSRSGQPRQSLQPSQRGGRSLQR